MYWKGRWQPVIKTVHVSDHTRHLRSIYLTNIWIRCLKQDMKKRLCT
jgi:hypothetical protein